MEASTVDINLDQDQDFIKNRFQLSRKYQRGEKPCQDIDDLRLVKALETGRDLPSRMIISTTFATISNIDNSPWQHHC